MFCVGCGRGGAVFAERETATPIRHARVRVCPQCWDRGWRLIVVHDDDPMWNLDADPIKRR